ncbi:MAG TPA: hypothetical protein VNT51_05165 [Miltoncostaeaceae bacterium]|nr:hypothetical protein [Miltoncostaeaceae bacterium]
MRSALLAVLGTALLLFGGFVAALGVGVRVLGGDEGTVAASGVVETSAAALVLPVEVITADPPGTRLGIDVTAGEVPLLVARAPRAAVRSAVAGVEHEVARGLENRPLRLARTRVDGTPGGRVRTDGRWTATDRGTQRTLTLEWSVEERDEEVLVARLDGGAGFAVPVRLRADVPQLAQVATVAAMAGGLVALVGVLFALAGLLGMRGAGRSGGPPGPATADDQPNGR